jgi:hypothetical protein
MHKAQTEKKNNKKTPRASSGRAPEALNLNPSSAKKKSCQVDRVIRQGAESRGTAGHWGGDTHFGVITQRQRSGKEGRKKAGLLAAKGGDKQKRGEGREREREKRQT